MLPDRKIKNKGLHYLKVSKQDKMPLKCLPKIKNKTKRRHCDVSDKKKIPVT